MRCSSTAAAGGFMIWELPFESAADFFFNRALKIFNMV
ncbi:hypothetical protein Z949_2852 [Sulfitobacter guttiformis KCTC 32187]|nr:hypothetical protein Z949_2852 [Sulfitobacter guttiformis KCTC 32187]